MKPGEWVQAVQGKPWVIGARGPDAFDCYGLLYWVLNHYFGQAVPRFDEKDYSGIKDLSQVFQKHFHGWEPVNQPFEGCAVSLSKSLRFTHHCGIWTTADRGLVVHSAKASDGVLAQSLKDMRRDGWKQIDFFRYNPKL